MGGGQHGMDVHVHRRHSCQSSGWLQLRLKRWLTTLILLLKKNQPLKWWEERSCTFLGRETHLISQFTAPIIKLDSALNPLAMTLWGDHLTPLSSDTLPNAMRELPPAVIPFLSNVLISSRARWVRWVSKWGIILVYNIFRTLTGGRGGQSQLRV